MRIVRCVDNWNLEDYLTAGKDYAVITEVSESYLLKNDKGYRSMYLKSRFTDLDDPKPNSIESIANEKPKVVVKGVGPDAPTVVNEKGGKQSQVLYRFDLLDPAAMF